MEITCLGKLIPSERVRVTDFPATRRELVLEVLDSRRHLSISKMQARARYVELDSWTEYDHAQHRWPDWVRDTFERTCTKLSREAATFLNVVWPQVQGVVREVSSPAVG